jgi:hypothetical protein
MLDWLVVNKTLGAGKQDRQNNGEKIMEDATVLRRLDSMRFYFVGSCISYSTSASGSSA